MNGAELLRPRWRSCTLATLDQMSQYSLANNSLTKLNDLPTWVVRSRVTETLNTMSLAGSGRLSLSTNRPSDDHIPSDSPSKCNRHPDGDIHLRDVETEDEHRTMTERFPPTLPATNSVNIMARSYNPRVAPCGPSVAE